MAISENTGSSELQPFTVANQPQLQDALNQLVRAANENRPPTFANSSSIIVKEGSNREFTFELSQTNKLLRRWRFEVSFDGEQQRLHVAVGLVAFVTTGGGTVTPIMPTIDMISEGEGQIDLDQFWGDGLPPYITAPTSSGDVDKEFWILVQASPETAEVILHNTDDELPALASDEFLFQVASFSPTQDPDTGEVSISNIDQTWASDITLVLGASSSSASTSESLGSDKGTCIVPCTFHDSKFTALFVEESPEVRFNDVMSVRLCGSKTMAIIDYKFVEVCSKGSILAVGHTVDRPYPVGIQIRGSKVYITSSIFPWRRPDNVIIRLSGIRKGFLGKRFPVRTKEQFDANEKTIQSWYPGSGKA